MGRAGRLAGLLLAVVGLMAGGTAVSVAAPDPRPASSEAGHDVDSAALTLQLIRTLAEDRTVAGLSRIAVPGPLVRPVPGAVTGWFGERRAGHRHLGVDFDGETGDPVRAAGAGRVVVAGWAAPGYGGYGRMVVVDHRGGMATVYAHLSAVFVGAGGAVEARTVIGTIGSTGSASGSHLHFEVRRDGVPVNPLVWLRGPGPRS